MLTCVTDSVGTCGCVYVWDGGGWVGLGTGYHMTEFPITFIWFRGNSSDVTMTGSIRSIN